MKAEKLESTTLVIPAQTGIQWLIQSTPAQVGMTTS